MKMQEIKAVTKLTQSSGITRATVGVVSSSLNSSLIEFQAKQSKEDEEVGKAI